jgi:hypothetical protein
MQNSNKFYRVVYELWTFFSELNLLLEGLFSEMRKLLIIYNIIIMKNVSLLLIVKNKKLHSGYTLYELNDCF